MTTAGKCHQRAGHRGTCMLMAPAISPALASLVHDLASGVIEHASGNPVLSERTARAMAQLCKLVFEGKVAG